MSDMVVVTGMGVVSPTGIGQEAFWHGLSEEPPAGERRVGEDFDPIAAGWVQNEKELRHQDRFTHLAGVAAMEAISQAGWNNEDFQDAGVFMGVGFGGLITLMNQYDDLVATDRIEGYAVPALMINAAAAAIAAKFNLRGPNTTMATACASGTDAIGRGYREILDGYAPAMIVGGTEAPLHIITTRGFRTALATSKTGESRPFSAERNGFVLSEGAAVLTLETYQRARYRGAPILATVLGYHQKNNAGHVTKPSPGGIMEERVVRNALQRAGIDTEEVTYVNAHGTATRLNDINEASVIYRLFDGQPFVTSIKGSTGHSLGAAGAKEAVSVILSMQHGLIPPTVGTSKIDSKIAAEAPINLVLGKHQLWTPDVAISTSFGFGGHNAALILGPPPEYDNRH